MRQVLFVVALACVICTVLSVLLDLRRQANMYRRYEIEAELRGSRGEPDYPKLNAELHRLKRAIGEK
jgi:hypothetical protein